MLKHLSRRRLLAGSALMAGSGWMARPAIAQNSLRGTGSVIVHFGGGSMGEAVLSGLRRSGRAAKDIVVAEKLAPCKPRCRRSGSSQASST